jgi:lipoyl-dependent peroxiredoxin subunit D
MIRIHGIDQIDFELWCIAVSAINGCGACADSHEKVARDKGFSEENVLAAVCCCTGSRWCSTRSE